MTKFELENLKQELFEEKDMPIDRFKKLLLIEQLSNNLNVRRTSQVISIVFKTTPVIQIVVGKALTELLLEKNGLTYFLAACDDLGIHFKLNLNI